MRLGTDQEGIWTPGQYGYDAAWSWETIHAVARRGVDAIPEVDRKELRPHEERRLFDWCRQMVRTKREAGK